MKSERVTFDHLLQVKSPKALADALDKAASSRLMSRSDFIRTTLADRLRADGVRNCRSRLMAGPGEVDLSFYKEAANASPFEFQNRLLEFQCNQQQVLLGQQAVQENAIKLATQRFGAINNEGQALAAGDHNAAAGLMSDPDLGKRDMSSELCEVLGRLTKGDVMSAQHAVQFMQTFPSATRL